MKKGPHETSYIHNQALPPEIPMNSAPNQETEEMKKKKQTEIKTKTKRKKEIVKSEVHDLP